MKIRFDGLASGEFTLAYIATRLKRVCLNLFRPPVTFPWARFNETHVHILGETGSGKGVLLASLATQCLRKGQAVCVFDPKGDVNLIRILAEEAAQRGVRFHLIDLDPRQGAQFSPFGGADAEAFEEQLVSGFSLENRGDPTDFYRTDDRGAAKRAAKLAVARDIRDLRELLKACSREESIRTSKYFMDHLTALASLRPVQSSRTLDFAAMIEAGDVIYVKGSTEDDGVRRLQKAVAMRIAQVIRHRPMTQHSRKVCLVYDEVRHLVSSSLLHTLAVIRSSGAHAILAGQSMADLDLCEGLAPGVARTTIIDNCGIKIVLKIGDAQYAEFLSSQSGLKRFWVKNVAWGGGDTLGSYREEYLNSVPASAFLALTSPTTRPGQSVVGFILGLGLARMFHIGRIPVSGPVPGPTYLEPERADKHDGGPI